MVVAGIAGLDLLRDAAARLVRDVLVRRRALLSDLVEEGRRDGSIQFRAAPAAVADLPLTIVQGMRVVDKGGRFPLDAGPLVALALQVRHSAGPRLGRTATDVYVGDATE